MPHQTIVSWNALITAFADNLYGNEALHTFFQMENGGFVADMVSFLGALRGCTSLASLELGQVVHSLLMESQYGLDVVLGNTMITMYGWCGSVDDAKIVFEKLLSPNIVSWRSMIGIYCRDGKGEEALGLFYQMHLQGFKPDEAILVGALEACATLGAHEQGQRVHAYLAEVGVFEVLVLENTLLSLYGKCGNLCDAWAIFRRMEKRDIISWTSIITGFCLCGYSKAALDLFSRMQLEGRLDEAEGLIKEAPAEIYSEACLCLLGACKVHGDIERGVYVANQIINMDLNTPLVHVMLSNLYAAMGRPDEAALIREALGRIRMQT
ncbi:hypothetical protein GOP47_0024446 [Adiantum capillus-veneris]|uniref:Pentatricopeptide repeat-containing protein n=1 Tax=Adiantum capillus-veneris TaxID=13818 RepID=A0A9D4Z520_ADICA|nr:hypothetical protein GOP47_0024446 [Adiantum capillus-veneris]